MLHELFDNVAGYGDSLMGEISGVAQGSVTLVMLSRKF